MNIKKEIREINDAFWLVVNRHRYKVRQFIKMSDKEYDEKILEIKNNVLYSRLWNTAFSDVITQLDTQDKKVQKGKKPAIMDLVNERMEEIKQKLEKAAEEEKIHE